MKSESRGRDSVHALPEWGEIGATGSEMGALIRAHDWAATPLGPIDMWPPSLRAAVDLMLACGFAAALAWGRQGIVLYNDAYGRIIGPRHPAALGQSTYTTFPESKASFAPVLARVWQGETVTLEDQPYPLLRAGGVEDAWFTLTYAPWRDETGAVAGVYAIMIDVTGRVRAEAALRASEARQAFLLRLSDALRPLADPIAIQETASRLLGAHLGVDRAAYGELEPGGQIMTVARDWARPGTPSAAGAYRIDDFGTFFTDPLRQGKASMIEDALTDPRVDRALYARTWSLIGVRAAIAYPLVKEGRFVAAFFIQEDEARSWTDGEVALVGEVGERTWEAVERARAEAALRRFAALAEASGEFIGMCDVRLMPFYVNAAGLRLVGLDSLEDARRTPVLDFFHPEDRAIIRDKFLPRVLREGRGEVEIRFRHFTTGETLWVIYSVVLLTDEHGQPLGYGTVTRDITARKQAHAEAEAERQHLRDVFMQAPAIIAVVRGPEHVFEVANPLYLQTVGRHDPAELLGQPIRETLPEVEGQGYFELLDQVYTTGQPFVGTEMPVQLDRRGDGTLDEVILNFVYQPLRNAADAVMGIMAHAVDVTEQVRARRRVEELARQLQQERDTLERRVGERTAELAAAVDDLRASEGRLRLLLEQMPAALWTTDRALRLTTLTGAALPAPLRAAAGQAVSDVFAALEPGGADAAPVAAHRQALTGASVGFEFEAEDRTYAAHVEPLHDAEARIVGVIGVAHDVTERTLLRLQDEFLALASHELRTPLTPALGYLEMVMAALDGATPARRYVARAAEQVGRLNTLVNDLLDVGRLRGGKLSLDRADIDLGAVVRRAVEAARIEAEAQGQVIALDAPAAPVPVRGDAVRLEQVALNLLTNAIKYAPESATIEARLRRDSSAGQAVLEVQDYGPGIPAADVPHLFSRFYQVARPDRPSRGGLGLGLYLARELTEAHGGTITVASTARQGTTFTVRLPLAGAGAGRQDRAEREG